MPPKELQEIENQIGLHLNLDNLVDIRTRFENVDTVSTFYGEIDWDSMVDVLRKMHLSEDAQFLDVGCGGGRWLLAAKELGCASAVGAEVVPERVQVARSVLGTSATVMLSDALKEDECWTQRPTHVVAYDKVFAPYVRSELLRRISDCASIKWVASWWPNAPLGFELVECVLTESHPRAEVFKCYVFKRLSDSTHTITSPRLHARSGRGPT